MSDTSSTESSSATEITESGDESSPTSHAAEPAPEPTVDSSAPGTSKLSHWAALIALPLAVIAIAAAALGWFFPHKGGSSSTPTYTEQQTKDAKAHTCAAFMTVDRAVVKNTHLKNPPDGGPVGQFAIQTSARLALYGGGAYLRDRLNLEPATPADLAKAVGNVSTILQELGMNYLAQAPEFAQEELRNNLNAGIKTIAERCKS
jgi:hypothetical protein